MTPKLSLLILSLLLASCSYFGTVEDEMYKKNHAAGRALIRNSQESISKSDLMIAASLADIDNLSSSTTFGRISTQQIMNEMSKEGYTFVDVLLRESIYVSSGQGEFLLSRNVEDISREHNANYVMVGTYAEGNRTIFVSVRLIRTADGAIVSAHDYTMPKVGSLFTTQY